MSCSTTPPRTALHVICKMRRAWGIELIPLAMRYIPASLLQRTRQRRARAWITRSRAMWNIAMLLMRVRLHIYNYAQEFPSGFICCEINTSSQYNVFNTDWTDSLGHNLIQVKEPWILFFFLTASICDTFFFFFFIYMESKSIFPTCHESAFDPLNVSGCNGLYTQKSHIIHFMTWMSKGG